MPEPEINFEDDWNLRRGVPNRVYIVHQGDSLGAVFVAEMECNGDRGESWRATFTRLIYEGPEAKHTWLTEGGWQSVRKDAVVSTPEDAVLRAREYIQGHILAVEHRLADLRAQREQADITIRGLQVEIGEVTYPTEADF